MNFSQVNIVDFNDVRNDMWTAITFRVSRRRREMYCGHARLCVSVCGRMPTLLHGPGSRI